MDSHAETCLASGLDHRRDLRVLVTPAAGTRAGDVDPHDPSIRPLDGLFDDHLVLFEAPVNEARTKAVIDKAIESGQLSEPFSVEVNPADLKVDTFRSSGAGGQHVNKTDSAVRITHLPTKIVVAVQNERSQHQNRERAMAVLRAKLIERQEEEREAELLRLRGKHVEAGWGNQIRSYVLQPYTMVKDLRTGVETANPAAVLDGDLDAFIDGYLRSRIGEDAAETA